MKTMTKIMTLLALLLTMNITTVWAASLAEAKANGVVGEQINGYLGLIKGSASSDVKALIKDINRKRSAAYAEKARKAGVDKKIIETRIGERLKQRAKSGQYIQNKSGRWIKKP